MKKLTILSLFLLTLTWTASADYFEKLPYKIKQPDGRELNLFITGDEFYSRIHDLNDFTVVQAPDGYYYYAMTDGDLLRPSSFRVGESDPHKAGLKKGVRISSPEYRSRFDRMNNFRTLRKGATANASQTGILNNIVIYIRFAGEAEFTEPRQFFFNSFNPSTGKTLNSYFREVSYSRLDIRSVHYPACELNINSSYQDYRKRNFFEPYNETTNPEGYKNFDEKTLREHSLLADAITWINEKSPVDPGLDLDNNEDGMVDNLCFIIRGGTGSWNDLIWAHRWTLYSKDVQINGKKAYSYIFLPEGQLSVKTLCHEMFHTLGAPDLYHYENQGVINPVGCWDIMEGGNAHMTAYMKWKYSGNSWIKTIPEITTSGTYRMNPLTSPEGNCYMIKSPVSEDEYFVLEYRKKEGTFESALPGSGLIVSRVDPAMKGNSYGPPDEIYIFRPGGTTTANGEYLEAYLCETSGRTAITDDTNPRSFLKDGSPGGLFISDIREEGGQLVFNVRIGEPGQATANPGDVQERVSVVTSATQVQEDNELMFTVYPNPASSYINLKIEESPDPVSIAIRDVRGTLVHSEEPGTASPGEVINIDVSDKVPGLYLVEVKNKKFRKTINMIKL